MTGIGCAAAGGGPYTGGGGPPPATFTVSFGANTGSSENVTGASGTAAQYFFGVVTNAVDPTTRNWTVTSNPSGKLGISGSGNVRNVTYSGMALFELETITVQFEVIDSGGNYFIDSASIDVRRTS